ncbi:MAG TPA: glycosyltransferase, partial [Candidatus Paceibacterota bacterium]
MNVLFISNDPSVFVDGTPTRERVRTYAKHIADEGGELHILTRARATVTIDDGSLHLHSVRTGKLLSPFVLARAGKKLIESHAINIVSAQDPFEHGIASLWAVRGTKAKLHVQAHTDFLSPWFTRSGIYRSPKVRMPLLNRMRVRIADRVLPRADGIRVVSERIRDSITSKYGQAVPQPSVIPIPVPTEVAPKVEFPPHAFKFALLSVGRLEPEKRIEDILAAVARLKDVYPSLGLFLANTGREEKKLKRMARALGIADRVVFLGHRPDVRGLMRSAQAFIQASSYEGYGMALIEAALARLPI